MPSNLALDDSLLEEALRVGGYPSKRETVNAALREFVARRKRVAAVELFGKVEFAPSYDHKRSRRR